MKYFLILVSILSLALVSCNSGEKDANPLADSLANVNNGLKNVVALKDSSLESFIVAFNDIQDNLNEIKSKQKLVSTQSSDAELRKNMKDQIIDDIQSINNLMEQNKQKIASLKSRLTQSNGRVDVLEKMITHLTTQLEEKELEITDLKNQLERMNIEVSSLTAVVMEKTEESNKKTAVINTAFYAMGTAKELKEKGIITKEGGFIGIGKSKKLAENFDKNYFTKIDITQTKSFVLQVKKAKLITTHPSNSYKIEGEKMAEKLIIANPDEFWGVNKYMVIVLEN